MKIADALKTKITKRKIQISLGILWLLDGALQLQHQMFSSNFANQVIAPSTHGQPSIVSGPINFEIHTILLHPAIFDTFFAFAQLALGVLILNRKTVRIGLLASVAWGLGVWYMGEGLAGLLSGHASLLVGAPGAALIYVVLALAVLPSTNKRTASKDMQIAHWIPLFWAALWLMGAFYQLLPGQNSSSAVASMISANASIGGPGWLNSLDAHVSNLIGGRGYSFVVILALLQAAIGLLIFLPGKARKIAVGMGVTLSLAFWVLGQSLGTYFSGLATDPNSGPLFILLGVATLGSGKVQFNLIKHRLASSVSSIVKLTSSSSGSVTN